MTFTKLRDPELHVILTTVDGESSSAKRRESQLKDTSWREVQTCRFMNTQDSAGSILDTILDIGPINLKLQYIQEELDRICTTLPTRTQLAPKSNRFFSLFGFIVAQS